MTAATREGAAQTVRIHASCAHGGGLLRRACGYPAVAECVYCGRPFCAAHGERGPDFTDACDRKECAAKLRDVAEHQDWKRRVAAANGVSVCAHEECAQRMHHQCSQCGLLFCDEHVKQRTILNRRVDPPREELGVVCTHCQERRKLWR